MKNILILSLLLTISGCSNTGDKMKVIGHRGAMGHETENTLASVQKALDLGVDMIEIDVFLLKSGEIAVFHDERLERLSNANGYIEDWNYSDLQNVTLDGNHKIPLLQDVMELMDRRVPLNIELKGANTAGRVNSIIGYFIRHKQWKLQDFVISSFNWEELRQMRIYNPDIAIAVLTEGEPLEALPIAQELGAVAVNPYFENLSAQTVELLHKEGFKVYTWTVNKEEDIERMREYAVDGIFTNYPERVR